MLDLTALLDKLDRHYAHKYTIKALFIYREDLNKMFLRISLDNYHHVEFQMNLLAGTFQERSIAEVTDYVAHYFVGGFSTLLGGSSFND